MSHRSDSALCLQLLAVLRPSLACRSLILDLWSWNCSASIAWISGHQHSLLNWQRSRIWFSCISISSVICWNSPTKISTEHVGNCVYMCGKSMPTDFFARNTSNHLFWWIPSFRLSLALIFSFLHHPSEIFNFAALLLSPSRSSTRSFSVSQSAALSRHCAFWWRFLQKSHAWNGHSKHFRPLPESTAIGRTPTSFQSSIMKSLLSQFRSHILSSIAGHSRSNTLFIVSWARTSSSQISHLLTIFECSCAASSCFSFWAPPFPELCPFKAFCHYRTLLHPAPGRSTRCLTPSQRTCRLIHVSFAFSFSARFPSDNLARHFTKCFVTFFLTFVNLERSFSCFVILFSS